MADFMKYELHLKQLDTLLFESKHLWLPHPFRIDHPEWCDAYPELSQTLLALDDASVVHYAANNDALISFISGFVPQLSEIQSLIDLPAASLKQHCEIDSPLNTGIPGRKWKQIRSLYQTVDNPERGVIEWCGGKGYLGRVLSSQWQVQVTTLEYNQSLVEAGKALADKFTLKQRFKKVDVLKDQVSGYLNKHHTIALHACGDLHRELIYQINNIKVPDFTIVPCCYHLGRDKNYSPFNHDLKLNLSRESLRLAVNETVTAHNNEIKKRDQDMAWKLAFQKLWQTLSGSEDYHSFKPVPKAWLKEGFEVYCRKLCQREKLSLPDVVDWDEWESRGYQRQHDVLRLQLLRQCFKRLLELWLILDMAVYLEEHGYDVSVHEFCERSITPRNIIIEGKLKSSLPLR